MYGLLNESTKSFEAFVPANELWKYIQPGYKAVEMSQTQASTISSSLGLSEPKSPEIVSANLIDGKIFTGTRLLETPTCIRISKSNYEHFAETQTEVPQDYYYVNDGYEGVPDANITRKELMMFKMEDFEAVSTVKEMQFVFEVLPDKISNFDIEEWCDKFGVEVVITEIKKAGMEWKLLVGVMDYAISNNDMEILDWLESKNYEIRIDEYHLMSETKLPKDYLIPKLLKICDTDDLIKSLIDGRELNYIKYLCDNIEYKHLEYACKFGLTKITKIIYEHLKSQDKLETNTLMDIAAECADVELMKYLHQQKYVYNVAELFQKYYCIVINASDTAIRKKYHSVVEEFAAQWTVDSLFDKFDKFYACSDYKLHEHNGRNSPWKWIAGLCPRIPEVCININILKDSNWWKRTEDYTNVELLDICRTHIDNKQPYKAKKFLEELIHRGIYDKTSMENIPMENKSLLWRGMLRKGFNPYECH